jgi:hypothetical protein
MIKIRWLLELGQNTTKLNLSNISWRLKDYRQDHSEMDDHQEIYHMCRGFISKNVFQV